MENDPKTPKTLKEAIEYFSDPVRCFNLAVSLRWKSGVTCPRCQGTEHSFLTTRNLWKCKGCKKQFSVKSGTIMEDSALRLDKWLTAIWLIANAKNGISSMEIHRALGVTVKTAWFLLHRIRYAMENKSMSKMTGIVEADETYVGGRVSNMHKSKKAAFKGRGTVGKAIVMGILERGDDSKHSKIHAEVIEDIRKETLHSRIKKNVKEGAEVFTDELDSYDGMEDVIHASVNHAEKYVDGNVHTNNVENFWTLFKRCLKGTYIAVDPVHLGQYVVEEVFRFNNRKATDGERFMALVSGVDGKRLTLDQLTRRAA